MPTRIPIYQVDAFTSEVFHGNPAAVCPLDRWLDDAVLQAIAEENNLAETAYFLPPVKSADGVIARPLRWFTPGTEIDLAGHPTLATAFTIFEFIEKDADALHFDTRRSGRLTVRRDGARLSMDFPSRAPEPTPVPPRLAEALGATPREVLKSRDYLCVFDSEAEVAALDPDMRAVRDLDALGIIVTAPGDRVDFVSRFFAPAAGVPEDPVTGSAHCTLIPYWAERLDKPRLHARQISKRGGELFLEHRGDRVTIAGHAVLFMQGTITLP